MAIEYVPIIDAEGNVIGKETRDDAHMKGLLHPAVRVLLRTSDGRFIFQKRSLTKVSNPGKITFSVTGHVQYGQTIGEAAVAELREESGVIAEESDLVFLGKSTKNHADIVKAWGQPHLLITYFYGLDFKGQLSDLVPEEGEVEGFLTYSLDELKALSPLAREEFSKSVFDDETWELMEKYATL